MLGLNPHHIALAEPHPGWPAAFATEQARIAAVMPQIAIEHIGSTAVPGLEAKPVLDLMVGVGRIAEHAGCIAPLAGLGYRYLGEYGIPGRHFFIQEHAGLRNHHLHLVEWNSVFWRDHLAFRNALRRDVALRGHYAELKHRLVALHPHDGNAYAGGKSDFIAEELAWRRELA